MIGFGREGVPSPEEPRKRFTFKCDRRRNISLGFTMVPIDWHESGHPTAGCYVDVLLWTIQACMYVGKL